MSFDANQIIEKEKIWTKRVRETWEAFAKENLGLTSIEAGPPACFETGDGHSYCVACPWYRDC